jgi:hypothetical protein
MWEMLGVVIAVISLGVTLLAERKKISAEITEIREGMKGKSVVRQQVTSDNPAPKARPALQVEAQPPQTGFQSTVLDILKTFVAIVGGTWSFACVVAVYYVIFDMPTNDGYYILILPGAMLAGFIFGVGVLRKRTWRSIWKFLGIVFFGAVISMLISFAIP